MNNHICDHETLTFIDHHDFQGHSFGYLRGGAVNQAALSQALAKGQQHV